MKLISLLSRSFSLGVLLYSAVAGLQAQSILVSTAGVSLSSNSGNAVPVSQAIAVTSSNGTNIGFQVTTSVLSPLGSNWLSADKSSANTPNQFTVFANAAALPVGTYAGNVQVSSPGTSIPAVNILVTFTVTGGTQLSAAPTALTFNYQLGGPAPPAQRLAVTSGGQAISYTAAVLFTTGGGWMEVSPASGTTPGSVDVNLPVIGVLSTAAPSTYTGFVVLTPTSAAGGSPLQIPVTLNVTGTPRFVATPSTLVFNYQTGQASPPQQTLNLSSLGAGATPFTASASTTSGGSWLVVTPNGGVTPAAFTVGVSANTLLPGTYSGTILVNNVGSGIAALSIPVSLTVSNSPLLSVSPNVLTFNYQPGGVVPPSQTLTPTSTSASLPYSVFATASGGNWLIVNPTTSTTPNPVNVSIDPTNLTPGIYTGTVTITGTGVGNPPQSVPVTLTIANTPILIVSAPTLTFNYQFGKALPVAQLVNVNSSGAPFTYTLSFTEVTGASYVVLSQTTGTTPGSFAVSMAPATLPGALPGVYQARITITAPGAANSPLVIPLSLVVSDKAILNVSPAALSFNYQQSTGTLPSAQFLSLTSTGDPANFTVTSASNGGWLTVGPSIGTTPANVTVQVTPLGLSPGTYNGSIAIASSIPGGGATLNSPTVIPVTLVITGGTLAASPSSLTFAQAQGGSAPTSQTINLSSTGIGLNYSTSASTTAGSWLTVTPANGFTPGALTVTANGSGLSAGTYSGLVTVSAIGASNTPLNIPVTLVVGAAQTLTVAPATLNFAAQSGGVVPTAQTVAVSSQTAGLAFTASASTNTGGSWLSVTPATGSTPGNITISVNPATLAAGTYTGTVSVASSGASNSPQFILVTLVVSTVPPPVPAAIVNAASFAPGPVAPGEVVTIGGTNIGPVTPASFTVANGQVGTTLSDTQVFFDGISATVLYTSQNQINAIVPYGIFGRTTVRVTVTYRGQTSTPIELRVADAVPALFAVAGSSQGAILNQTGTVNGANNPAPKGSVIVLYATGEGQTSPLGVDGRVTPVDGTQLKKPILPVTATIGGVAATVEYSGSAPGLISGVMQINVRVPANVGSGNLAVMIAVGAAQSQTNVTAAIQ